MNESLALNISAFSVPTSSFSPLWLPTVADRVLYNAKLLGASV
jgi:hypothetical protein